MEEMSSDECSISESEDIPVSINDNAAGSVYGKDSSCADNVNSAKEYEAEVVEEEMMLQKTLVNADPENLESILKKFSIIFSSTHVFYQDILPMVLDGRKFILDGESLLLLALTSGTLSEDCGGQTLHVVYIVEKFLNTLVVKGLKFFITFCKAFSNVWLNLSPSIALARESLKLHLNKNTQFQVKEVDPPWEKGFVAFVQLYRPSFYMTFVGVPKLQALERVNFGLFCRYFEILKFLIQSQLVCCSLMNLDVVDLDSTCPAVSTIFANVHVSSQVFKISGKIHKIICSVLKRFPHEQVIKQSLLTSSIPHFSSDVRMIATVKAAVAFLRKEKDVTAKMLSVVRIIILHTVLLCHLPLKYRCFQNLPEPPYSIMTIVNKFQYEMVLSVHGILKEVDRDPQTSLSFQALADIWHGHLFKTLYCVVVKLGGLHQGMLRGEIAEQYKEMVSIIFNFLGTDKEDYYFSMNEFGSVNINKAKESKPAALLKRIDKLIPTSCKLTSMFCSEITTDVMQPCSDPLIDRFLKMVSRKKKLFQEVTHWHVNKPLTDEYDRVSEQKAYVANPRHSQTQKNTHARFLTYYGQSLEGNFQPHVIVSCKKTAKPPVEKQNNLNPVKKVKASKPTGNKEKIIQENMKKKASKNMQLAQERLKTFMLIFNGLISKGLLLEAAQKCDNEIQSNIASDAIVLQLLFRKLEASFKYWCIIECDEYRTRKSERNMSYAKELFITIQKVLMMSENCSLLIDAKDIQLLSRVLFALGFTDLARIWDIPNTNDAMENKYSLQMSHVEFQLMHLSSDLDRDSGEKPDPRVQGFNPDPWQSKLFDIIDSNQSAVVVAPTSSGKTYASYYCMEKVLKESDNGLVVYVCPSKALVNQVYATIFVRFRKSMPAGKALQGVFTRDFKSCDANCQILVTVPECLELLLLSPRKHTWTQRLKYVIFDEVHCLVGQSGGIAWENSLLLIRCPFLALSATINEPEAFRSWLQKAESFKQAQGCGNRPPDSYKVHLVIHTERHNHLKKSVLHMDGSLEKIHPYALLDETLLKECGGVPKHISLSPDETLQLFNAMKGHLPEDLQVRLSPDHYFKSVAMKGFLTMPLVKLYSDELRNALESLSGEKVVHILNSLHQPNLNAECGPLAIYQNISKLLHCLKERNMFPALIFTYNRMLINVLSLELLTYLEDQGNSSESEGEEEVKVKESSLEKKNPKQEKRSLKFTKKFQKELRLLGGSSILKSNSSIRGEGHIDDKLVEFIEFRLKKLEYSSNDVFPRMLRRGLGKHYGGMNNIERSSVEMLFRMKALNMVFATGTLAQGIHMPCKTVVVAGDSQYLNALEYHQMSGRAGRRGYDNEGNVIFFGLNQRKIKTLMTANVPKMVGNFPISMTLVLRLLLLVSDVTDKGVVSEESTKAAISSCYVLLENSLLFETCPDLKDQIKHFFLFAHQFLICQGLLDDGKPLLASGLVTHLHYHEPSNFAFVYLLNNHVLEDLCEVDGTGMVTFDSLINLMVVLNFLFAPLPFKKQLWTKRWNNSKVILPTLPSSVYKALKNYNRDVLDVFSHYYSCVSSSTNKKLGEDVSLPVSKLAFPCQSMSGVLTTSCPLLSEIKKFSLLNNVCSAFAGLSGNTDHDIFPAEGRINNVRHEIDCFVKIVPTIILDIQYNSYALDFFRHGIGSAIREDNGLKSGEDFRLLKDFSLILSTISVSLGELVQPNNKLLQALNKINDTFTHNFYKCYYVNKNL